MNARVSDSHKSGIHAHISYGRAPKSSSQAVAMLTVRSLTEECERRWEWFALSEFPTVFQEHSS